jgi:hypothetical protein
VTSPDSPALRRAAALARIGVIGYSDRAATKSVIDRILE